MIFSEERAQVICDQLKKLEKVQKKDLTEWRAKEGLYFRPKERMWMPCRGKSSTAGKTAGTGRIVTIGSARIFPCRKASTARHSGLSLPRCVCVMCIFLRFGRAGNLLCIHQLSAEPFKHTEASEPAMSWQRCPNGFSIFSRNCKLYCTLSKFGTCSARNLLKIEMTFCRSPDAAEGHFFTDCFCGAVPPQKECPFSFERAFSAWFPQYPAGRNRSSEIRSGGTFRAARRKRSGFPFPAR